jgi:hypothetical protein
VADNARASVRRAALVPWGDPALAGRRLERRMAATRVQVGHAEAQKGLDPGTHHRGAVTAMRANEAVVVTADLARDALEPTPGAGICRAVWNHQ